MLPIYIPVLQFGFREKQGTIAEVNRLTGEIRLSWILQRLLTKYFMHPQNICLAVFRVGRIFDTNNQITF